MRTVSILVFIACFAVSIGGHSPHEFWQDLIFGADAEGVTGAN